MYKIYQEYDINLVYQGSEQRRLYTAHFHYKIKPGVNAFLPYYYSPSICNPMFYIVYLTWLKYDHSMTIGPNTAVFPFDKLFSTDLSTDPVDKLSKFLTINRRDDFQDQLFIIFSSIIQPITIQNQL